MSGLIALLDDVTAIAKVAAASVDDIAGAAAKAGSKAAGVVIDDAAVTPKYVHGFAASRELPIIGRIAFGSVRNKLVILLPAALLLSAFAPWVVTPLLMLGGLYLCFEGAEKVVHVAFPHRSHAIEGAHDPENPAQLEEEKVAGAIKTDFILSAEIMTIALAALPDGEVWVQAAALAMVAVGITALVYGSVALIVKMDDIGLHLAREARTGLMRRFGCALVRAMPRVMALLSAVGTAAMIWVGGSIVVHGLDVLGWGWPAGQIHDLALALGHAVPAGARGAVEWAVTAGLDGVIGLALGLAIMPLALGVVTPLWQRITTRK